MTCMKVSNLSYFSNHKDNKDTDPNYSYNFINKTALQTERLQIFSMDGCLGCIVGVITCNEQSDHDGGLMVEL